MRRLRAEMSIDGAIWHLKQVPDLLRDKVFELDTHAQRIAISPFGELGGRSVFANDRLGFEASNGMETEGFESPMAAFAGHTRETPWKPVHAAYFASEALWTYLTSPFLYTYPGFTTREIEPWHEDGETWRRLEVTFPPHIASHTRTQVTHFGADGLMRRHDYTVDILGGATGANYPGDYREVQGLRMPMSRRIYAYDNALQKVPEPLLVSIDIASLAFS
jgi:hypothetical protein